jgi:hypothetical protein
VDGQDHNFLARAFSLSKIVRCPCSRCQNTRCLENKTTIAIHLCMNGFVPGYEVWKFHDKSGTRVIVEDEWDYDMVVDWMDEMLEAIQVEVTEDPPIVEVEAFFKLLKATVVTTSMVSDSVQLDLKLLVLSWKLLIVELCMVGCT